MTATCRHCGRRVDRGHQCVKANRYIPAPTESDASNFLISTGIGAVTDNAIIGGLVGGSIAGGILGDALAGDGGFFG